MENSRYIKGKSVTNAGSNSGSWHDDDLLFSADANNLFRTISDSMRGEIDIEDVISDPELNSTRKAVSAMMAEYKKESAARLENESFIKSALAGTDEENELNKEVLRLKQEAENNDLNSLTALWVKEWRARRESNTVDLNYEERHSFISGSLNTEVHEPVEKLVKMTKKGSSGRLLTRYLSLSAAALLGAFLVIRTLLPSDNSGKIFTSYYEPLKAISPVTRNTDNAISTSYISAINSYKSGDYQSASLGFEASLEKDPSSVSSRFFLGMTYIETGDYEKAIDILSAVASSSGEYVKEARWYLGLTYLKTGNKTKASECFDKLAGSPGFYSERSAKILRRLR